MVLAQVAEYLFPSANPQAKAHILHDEHDSHNMSAAAVRESNTAQLQEDIAGGTIDRMDGNTKRQVVEDLDAIRPPYPHVSQPHEWMKPRRPY